MSERIFRCCTRKPEFSVIYSVSDEQKHYHVCSVCIQLEYFSKYIIEKTPISHTFRKKFQNEISDKSVETEIIGEKFGETVEPCENLPEQIETQDLKFCSKIKRGAKL